MVGLSDIPVITLNGDNPVYIRQFDTYEDAGATAVDKQDGDLTSNILTTGTVDINTPGEYSIAYNVKDSDNNNALTVTRKVVVIDRDRPIITLNGGNPTYVTITKPYNEAGAIAYDINYGDISSSIVKTGTVDTNTLGTYYLKYNVTNVDGIKAPEVIRKVIVQIPQPKIELVGSDPTLVEIGTSYTELGAIATDEVDGDITNNIVKTLEHYNTSTKKWEHAAAVNATVLGKYRMKYSITNSYGANAFVYRNIEVVKVDGPIISYNPNNGAASKQNYQTTISVSKNRYDINTSTLKYFVKSNWDYGVSIRDESNYKYAYVDKTVIKMTKGTGYYTVYARAEDVFGNLTIKGSGTFRLDNSRPTIDMNSGPSKVLLGSVYSDPGATAYDEYYDKNITSKIITTSNVDTSKLGIYYVTYQVTDSAGNTTVVKRKIEVYHPAPKIFLIGGSTVDLLYGTNYVERGATATDEIDGDLTSKIKMSGTVNSMKEGTYYIRYEVTNSSGYTTTRDRTVNVYVPDPVITLNGSSYIKVLIHTSYTDAGATASDVLDGDLTSRLTSTGTVDINTAGTYKIQYSVTNNLGKVGKATRTVVVYQPQPVITILGVKNVELIKGATYSDAGATAWDEIDGDITGSLTVSSNVNTSKAGTYSVTYSVTNSEGQTATDSRSVVVREPIITITLNGSRTVQLPIGTSYSDAGATANDELLGDVTYKLTSTQNINPNVLGTYYVNYTVTSSGVTKTDKRTVKVVPLPGPIITFNPNGNSTYAKQYNTAVTVSKGNYNVDTSSLKYLWKTDLSKPDETNFSTGFTSGDVITTPVGVTGKYYLFILAKDIYGNVSIMVSNAFYLDNTAPVLTLKGLKVVQTPVDGSYTDLGVDVVEVESGLNSSGVVVTSTVVPGVIGTYTVTYNATDKAGNKAISIKRTVSVVEASLKDAPGADFVPLYDASYFVGNDPHNWIEFGNAANNQYDYIPIMWRIIKANNEGIKIIYEGTKTTSGTTQNGTIGSNQWDTVNNTWNRPASVRSILNNFYTNFNENDKDTLTKKINWCVGKINSPYAYDNFKNDSCSVLGDQPSSVGLLNAGDYILTSKDPCGGYNEASCGTNNFLKKDYSYFTITGDVASDVAIFIVNSNGGLTRDEVTKSFAIRPVVNLRPDVLILSGEGTFDNPYKLNARTPIVDSTAPTVKFTPDTVVGQLATGGVEVVVTDDISGVDASSLAYVWTTTATQPSISTITNVFANGDTIMIPASSGTYYLWVLAKDNKGNQSISKGGVYSIDNNAPVITLNGSATVNIPVNSAYTDAGATALDNIDGNVTSKITVTSNLVPTIPGTYYIRYNVADVAGNKAIEVVRTIVVYETTPPTTAFNPNGNSGYASKANVSVSVTDNMALDNSSLKYLWTTSSTEPSAASFTSSFTNYSSIPSPIGVVGDYYLWIYAKDETGNISITPSNVYHIDNVAPVITLIGNATLSVVKDGVYSDPGATALDSVDGNVTSKITATSNVNTSVTGVYTVTYTVTDNYGNTATSTRTVQVESVSTLGLIPAIGGIDYADGNQVITINGVSYDVEFINVMDDTTYTTNTNLGNSTADQRMLVVKYHGNLTINSGVTVTATTRKKGMFIYVAGTLTNNGTITMTARGATAAGQNIYLWKKTDGSYEYIPAAGGAGAPKVIGSGGISTRYLGVNGSVGTARGTGGGGSGGTIANGRTTTSGAGAAGTSYSGGSGGGGAYYGATAGPGIANGGAGGYGAGNAVYTWSCGGGAGNPGGAGANGGGAGAAGTGGLLIVRAYNVINNGTMSSNGSAGGTAYRTGGGGSGGGSVNVFYVGSLTQGTMTATGGAYGVATRSGEDAEGGAGGAGTVTKTQIAN